MDQNSLFLILAAPACAWVAGMGLFKTLFLVAIMQRWVSGGDFAGPMAVFGNPIVFYPVLALGAVELIVDMIPRWDIQWQRFTVYLRILGAIVLSWFILYQEDVMSRVIMCIVGTALAITSFAVVMSARKASVRGRTINFVAPIASITEDCLIATTLLALVFMPPMTLLLILFMSMASMLIMYVVRNEARETLRWIFGGPWVQPHPEKENGDAADDE